MTEIDTKNQIISKVLKELYGQKAFILVYDTDNNRTSMLTNIADELLLDALKKLIAMIEEQHDSKSVQH